MIYDEIEEYICQYPIYQYAFAETEELEFSDKVRSICRKECSRYGHSWSCPPAVGSVKSCHTLCLSYPKALLFSTVAEVEDYSDMDKLLESKEEHELITRQIVKHLKDHGVICYTLSSDSCSICDKCAYPRECRHKEAVIPCIESHGIVLMNAIEKYHMDFYLGDQNVLWFSLIFLKNVHDF
jgi:predicted metal-binding protein